MIECPECNKYLKGRKCDCGYEISYKQEKPQKVIYKKQGKRASKELMQECVKLAKLRMNNKITTFELAEKMYELHKKYPRAGFDKEADKLIEKSTNPEKRKRPSQTFVTRKQYNRQRCCVQNCENLGTTSQNHYGDPKSPINFYCSKHSTGI